MKREKMSDLEKMLMKGQKHEGEMSKEHLDVKMEMLKELMEHAKKGMGDKILGGLEGLKKVTVAAPSKEGLEEGLEKAQELLHSKEMPEMEEESEEESEEQPEEASDKSPAAVEEESKEEKSEEMPKMEEEEDDYSPFMKRKKK